ncbi:MAG: dienelactone hydrolase family protein [Gammaproteobacteria bacterium]|nr:dienelactone hydrolase family protein [Gammaproteobacteria bacterium]
MCKISFWPSVLGISLLLFNPNLHAEILSETINYEVAGQPFEGTLSYDDSIKGKRPGVLVVHEWWGHNAYAKKRTVMLAKLGYTAFALDMYGKGKVADHPKDAQTYMDAALADMKGSEARFNAALKLLENQPTVEAEKIAAIGYCFGGGMVLYMAKVNPELAGVVGYHGALGIADKAKPTATPIKTKILVFNGAADPFVTKEQIDTFEKDMKTNGADYEFINYPGIQHSFTNPDATDFGKRFNMPPLVYDEKADKDSWEKTQGFFKKIFK